MKKKYKCFALFSGGLDSMLAVVFMQKLGYEVLPIFFETPFFGSQNAKKAAEHIKVELIIRDITRKHIEMLKNPRYGFGKYMNPCIDCHGLMFKEAASLMKEFNIDFIISGEVVGQRPMSQRRDALNAVGKLSGIKDLLVRPLSQKLLQDTLPIREGWVNKEDMLDIQGRGRHRQMQTAREFGIIYYQTPGGGCLLTDEAFSRRLKDLIEHEMLTINFIEFLKVGRHFRINDHLKVVVGRNDEENGRISKLAGDEIILQTSEIPGPIGAINSQKKPDKKEIKTAASILLRYNNKASGSAEVLYGKNLNLNNSIKVEKMSINEVKKLQL